MDPLLQAIDQGNVANARAREQEITRLNEVCRANQSTVDLYKSERDTLRRQRDALREALEKIAEVCNGYGNEAGWACRHARAALAACRD